MVGVGREVGSVVWEKSVLDGLSSLLSLSEKEKGLYERTRVLGVSKMGASSFFYDCISSTHLRL